MLFLLCFLGGWLSRAYKDRWPVMSWIIPCWVDPEFPERMEVTMCDWSLHAVRTEDAKAGDRLMLSTFRNTATRAFTRIDGDSECAVCMKPGTQVCVDGATAIFAHRNEHIVCTHHDCFEFVNGDVRFANNLPIGTICDVLQMPLERMRGPIEELDPLAGRRTMEDITA